MTNKALVEALEQLSRLPSQVRLDLGAAHSEICKLQGLDPKKHTWPEWSSIANTLRWLDVLEDTARTALASSGNEAPGDDKGLVERVARAIYEAEPLPPGMPAEVFGFDAQAAFNGPGWVVYARARAAINTALSSGNEVAKVVGWLLADADRTEAESRKIIENSHGLSPRDIQDWRDLVATKRGIANAIERGDHLATDAAPLTGGGGNG